MSPEHTGAAPATIAFGAHANSLLTIALTTPKSNPRLRCVSDIQRTRHHGVLQTLPWRRTGAQAHDIQTTATNGHRSWSGHYARIPSDASAASQIAVRSRWTILLRVPTYSGSARAAGAGGRMSNAFAAKRGGRRRVCARNDSGRAAGRGCGLADDLSERGIETPGAMYPHGVHRRCVEYGRCGRVNITAGVGSRARSRGMSCMALAELSFVVRQYRICPSHYN